MWINIPGVQGHVAYPHRADNPVTKLGKVLTALAAIELDDGNSSFQPSNLEVTTADVGNPAANIIPEGATARLNIRFNTEQKGAELVERVRRIVDEAAPGATVDAKISGEAFLTPAGTLYDVVTAAIEEETGLTPSLSTAGGTSDGRFLIALCPVVDFGLPNATMHKVDEAAAVSDIHKLQRIYAAIIRRALGQDSA
jgi:succinyl-diaminopimelate desuccinylase